MQKTPRQPLRDAAAQARRDRVLVPELCEQRPVSTSWVYGEIREGRLPYYRAGRHVFVSLKEFDAFTRQAAELHAGADL